MRRRVGKEGCGRREKVNRGMGREGGLKREIERERELRGRD